MTQSDFHGMYEYKGFTIWCPNDYWIAEPDWSEEAIENYKYHTADRHKTIAAARKWINKEGIKLKEEDYL